MRITIAFCIQMVLIFVIELSLTVGLPTATSAAQGPMASKAAQATNDAQTTSTIATNSSIASYDSPDIPGEDVMHELIRIGERVKAIQKQYGLGPFGVRSEDKVSTFDSPLRYNAKKIIDSYENLKKNTPLDILIFFTESSVLPINLPPKFNKDVVFVTAKTLDGLSELAQRWLYIYPVRFVTYGGLISHNTFEIVNQLNKMKPKVTNYDLLVGQERTDAFVWIWKACLMLNACDVGENENISVVKLQEAIQKIESAAKEAKNKLYKIDKAFDGVRITKSVQNGIKIWIPMIGTDGSFLEYFNKIINKNWGIPNQLSFEAFEIAASDGKNQYVEVHFNDGKIPSARMNETGFVLYLPVIEKNSDVELYDEILAHEFAHILGFPDCYLEFWDETAQGILYYSIDAKDFMCGVSKTGPSMARKLEILKVYSK